MTNKLTAEQVENELIHWAEQNLEEINTALSLKRAVALDQLVWLFLETKKELSLPSGSITMKDHYGGYGRGDNYWMIIEFSPKEGALSYFRKSGWYAPYTGGEYDMPLKEVMPVKKTVTVFEKI